MEHRPIKTIQHEATVVEFPPQTPETKEAIRRARLERLADILEQHPEPLNAFSRVEYLPDSERRTLRLDGSPLTIAYRDVVLQSQGLNSDRFGDAVDFFDLSLTEAHDLFCDCHYSGPITGRKISSRARIFAHRMSAHDLWQKAKSALHFW